MRARLLSYNNAPVWQIDGEIVTGLQADHIRFPELPGNLYARPTLIWSLDNEGGARHRVEASYLASHLTWNADYVLTVGRDDKAADLDGWVTLTNGSGTSFRNAALQLVAGDLNRVRQMIGKMAREEARRDAAAAPPVDDSGSVLRLSPLHAWPEDDHQQQRNQAGEHARCDRLPGSQALCRRRPGVLLPQCPASRARRSKTSCRSTTSSRTTSTRAWACRCRPVSFVSIRPIRKAACSSSARTASTHTPKDETLNLKIGNAFDLVAERKQVDFEKIASNVYEVEYEVTLRNHKPVPATVEVNEPIGGTWRILRSTHEETKTDAWAARFEVPVAADGETTLKYRVRVTY